MIRPFGTALAACAAIAFCSTASALASDQPDLLDAAKKAFNLTGGEIVNIPFDTTPGHDLELAVPYNGELSLLSLHPFSNRAPDYRVFTQIDSGEIVEVPPSPVRTMRGLMNNDPAALVAAAVSDAGLRASVILPGEHRLWVEPLFGRVPGAHPFDHVVYTDAEMNSNPGICGMDDVAVNIPVDDAPATRGNEGDIYCAELALDADFEYYSDYGSSAAVEDQLNAVINGVNMQYESQCGIRHVITAIVIRTTSNDPYTSSDSDTLVCQFLTEWTNSTEFQSLPWDVAKLFTGRDINGGVIGQATNFAQICDRQGFCTASLDNGAFCYSQNDCCGSFGCSTDLCAHELGHLWGAMHCNCPNETMNPFITCVNTFGTPTRNVIINHRNSRDCLELNCPPPPTGAENDNCVNAFTALEGDNPFTTIASNTDGPTETVCSPFGGGSVIHDVWFSYTSECDGPVAISTCGCDFDSALLVYSGGCPVDGGARIACNNNFDCNSDGNPNNDGGASGLTFNAVAGVTYLIRIGGYNGVEGSGVLHVDGPDCNPGSACPCDWTPDHSVNSQDFFDFLAGFFEGDADLNNDGSTTSQDFFEFLDCFFAPPAECL